MEILLAGFGGQGILFAGKVLAYAGLMEEKQVSWLPSYGPEMRGGTANCSVCISRWPVGSPLVLHPDLLVAMNLPSYEKFIGEVIPGGTAVIDSSLVEREGRDGIACRKIAATALADREKLSGLANIIILGKAVRETGLVRPASVERAIETCVPPRKKRLLEPNLRAFRLGMSL